MAVHKGFKYVHGSIHIYDQNKCTAVHCTKLDFYLEIHHSVSNGVQYVTGFRKTDHIVTIDIARNTDLKY